MPVRIPNQMSEEQGRQELEMCTQKIRRGLVVLMTIIEPLERVRKEKLYAYARDDGGRQLYRSFEEYTRAEFGFARSYYSKLKSGRDAMLKLEQHVEPGVSGKIDNPRAAYEMSLLPQDCREEAARELAAEAGDGKVTARMVRAWNDARTRRTETDGKTGPRRLEMSFFPDDLTAVNDEHAKVLPSESKVLSSESEPCAKAIAANANVDDDMPEPPSPEGGCETAGGSTLVGGDAVDEEDCDYEGDGACEDADDDDTDDDDTDDDNTDDGDTVEDDEEDDVDRILDKLERLLDRLAKMYPCDERDAERVNDRISYIIESFWGYVRDNMPCEYE